MAQTKKVDEVVADLVVEPVVDPVPTEVLPEGKVKIELLEVKDGFQTIFTTNGTINFENGVTVVDTAIANELRQSGQIK